MKTSKKTGKDSTSKAKKSEAPAKGRKMEPLKSKEMKNQRFDDGDEDEDIDPEMLEDNFKEFDEFYDADEDEE
jgi:hypothetical protein